MTSSRKIGRKKWVRGSCELRGKRQPTSLTDKDKSLFDLIKTNHYSLENPHRRYCFKLVFVCDYYDYFSSSNNETEPQIQYI